MLWVATIFVGSGLLLTLQPMIARMLLPRLIDARDALGYYSVASPIGRLFRALPPGARPRRVGVVGLGAGCLLAYAEPGQRWTLFEIDPLVKRIAEDERYFSYLPEARKRGVEAEVVLGDARLTLASAAGPGP